MTPEEKAESLVISFRPLVVHDKDGEDGFEYSREVETYYAKQCAFIAVDEIINSSPSLPILGDSGSYGEDIELSKIYWEEVKQEIKNI
jgi:hypothetical protein